jgi:hypothetical protein
MWRPREPVFRLHDERRGGVLRTLLHDIGDPQTFHKNARRMDMMMVLLRVLRADSHRLLKLSDRLTSEEIFLLRGAVRATP